MNPERRRVIKVVQDMQMADAFYRDVLGLPMLVSLDDEHDWLEFDAGACRIALHKSATVKAHRRQPKPARCAENDVSAQALFIAAGAKRGGVQALARFNSVMARTPKETRNRFPIAHDEPQTTLSNRVRIRSRLGLECLMRF